MAKTKVVIEEPEVPEEEELEEEELPLAAEVKVVIPQWPSSGGGGCRRISTSVTTVGRYLKKSAP